MLIVPSSPVYYWGGFFIVVLFPFNTLSSIPTDCLCIIRFELHLHADGANLSDRSLAAYKTLFLPDTFQHLHGQWGIPLLYFFGRRCMGAREVVDGGVVLLEQGFVMGYGVIFAEESPYAVAPFRTTAFKLGGHQFSSSRSYCPPAGRAVPFRSRHASAAGRFSDVAEGRVLLHRPGGWSASRKVSARAQWPEAKKT